MTGLWWLIPVKLIADVTDLGFMVRLWVALFIVRLLSVIPNKMYEAFFCLRCDFNTIYKFSRSQLLKRKKRSN